MRIVKQRIGLLVNTQKKEAVELAQRLLVWGKEREILFLAPPFEASILGISGVPDKEWRSSVSFAVVIGGDGTFLRAARYLFGYNIPLFGINAGNLGFLAAGDPVKAEEDIERILRGEHTVENRCLLSGKLWRGDRMVHELYAMNDLVVTKGAFARLIHLQIYIRNRYITTLPSDGMIIASPTGSTAYALSAGGPVVPPHVPCMLLVPICAHTLYARPLVLGETDVVSVVPLGDHRELMLTQDGQLGYEIIPGDRLEVSLMKDKCIKTITLPERDYYALLQEKFQWGRTYEDNGE
ncbi:MAG TPA: NAD(+)/NADH kinase [Synergistaceae bacterium]|nr:NAD(+)/NADH kinase [Synergistaceae bacterium]HPQ37264.1 NAD(+)/NADH kinase [Synergistaceae bacterium]